MNTELALLVIAAYFGILLVISLVTGRKSDHKTFFTGNRASPWYAVAFGMIGATLSGVTFISIPGAVGNSQFGYMQIVIGYLLGYFVIATVLLPLYYKLNLTSIYQYLRDRFGNHAYKTGAVYFLLSRIIGASLRLYLIAMVIQLAVCDALGVPFEVTVFLSIGLIYLYTFRGGIKTVVWTDTLQTFCMLLAAGLTIFLINDQLGWSLGEMVSEIRASDYSDIFSWDMSDGRENFIFQFLTGAFMTIVMTGLDQDMMQKNLTCRNLGDAQKNMFWFSIVLVFANILFLSLGALLYLYGSEMGFLDIEAAQLAEENCAICLQGVEGLMDCRKTDELFPVLALNHLGPVAGVVFVLGVIAAAYSSADSALTALTTSFCVDILDFEEKADSAQKLKTRYLVHVAFAVVLLLVIIIFSKLNEEAVIWEIFKAAGYTYGPLLGLYAFGLFTKRQVNDRAVPFICIAAPILSYGIQVGSPSLLGYTFGFEILLVNGLLTFLGLFIFKK